MMGPWDLTVSKRAHNTVKKPVFNMDTSKEIVGENLPCLAIDIASLAFTLWNVANALVTELASIRGTFIWFHEQISGSIDRMAQVLMKEQVVVQQDRFAAFKLLEWIAEALERSSPRQAEAERSSSGHGDFILEEEAGYLEAAQPVVGIAPQSGCTRTPLFLPSDENTDPSDKSFVSGVESSSSKEGKEGDEEDVEEAIDEMDVDQNLRG
jgi:hypothetical protein